MELVQFILKAVVGTCLFALILWCAQSRNPRAAGMTFDSLAAITTGYRVLRELMGTAAY